MTIFGKAGALSLGILTTTLVATFSGAAHAGEAQEHDGLYVRLGGGLAYGWDVASTDSYGGSAAGVVVSEKASATPKGFGGASELAVGYSVLDGLAIGGGLYSLWFSPKADGVKVSGTVSGNVDQAIKYDMSSFHVLGPFIDYYPDSSEGLHLQAGFGYGWLSLGDAHTTVNVNVLGVQGSTTASASGGSASGFGLMAGIGDEWWVADSWSIGVSFRLTAGFMSGRLLADDRADWSQTVWAPAVLFTATMN